MMARLTAPIHTGTRFAACAALLGALATSAYGQAPAEELLRLVPEDAGFCLVVRDLRGRSAELLASPLAEAFQQSPLGRAARTSPEFIKLTLADQFIRACLGVGLARIRDDIFGDAVVLAFRPGPPGKPELDEGVVLLRARDEELLARLIDRVNDAQRETGDLKELAVRRRGEAEYVCRTESNGQHFYYRRGPLLAASGSETVIRGVIDRDRQTGSRPGSEIGRWLRRLGVDDGLASLWVNPRAFDAAIEQAAAEAVGPAALVHRTVLGYWKSIDGIGAGVALRRDAVEARLGIVARADHVAAPLRGLFRGEGQPSFLWANFPEDSLLTVAGRFDGPSLREFVGDLLGEDARRALRETLDRKAGPVFGGPLGRDLVQTLGPDWGLCVTPPPRDAASWLPRLVAAVRVQPGDREPPVDRTLFEAVNAFVTLAVLGYNAEHADKLRLRSEMQGPVEVRYLRDDRLFPAGVRPAFALKGGYLLVASHPDAIRSFRESSPAGPLKGSRAEIPLLRMSLGELGNFIEARRDELANHLAAKQGLPREDVAQRLNRVAQAVHFLVRAELVQQPAPDRLSLVLRVYTALPLRR